MSNTISRKEFLIKAGSAIVGSSLISTLGFPSVILPRKKEKIGVALAGLGQYSNGQLAPGLQGTEFCELRGIVTGTPSKIPKWQRLYNIPDKNVYSYDTMHELADNDDIDVVYIVVPPGLHATYGIRAADAGKHVWCEKPMDTTTKRCQALIDACNKNKVQLTIGYRMQHEPNTQTIMKYARENPYGPITSVATGAGYNGWHSPDSWRTDPELGGGALYDMGVYPINGARYATGMEPVAVSGKMTSNRSVYDEVDETTKFTLEFPGGLIAEGETSFGKSTNYLEVDCENGWYELKPFQSYSGVKGKTSDGKKLPPAGGDQQARQMDNDARAILENKKPIVPGEEGLRDIHIVEAIQESSKKGGVRVVL